MYPGEVRACLSEASNCSIRQVGAAFGRASENFLERVAEGQTGFFDLKYKNRGEASVKLSSFSSFLQLQRYHHPFESRIRIFHTAARIPLTLISSLSGLRDVICSNTLS